MTPTLVLIDLDGREVEGSSPREIIEALRAAEDFAPSDLGSYLDLLGRRGEAWNAHLEVGGGEDDLDLRCRKALASLIRSGWLRAKAAPPAWPPRPRPRAAAPLTVQISAA
ncbi:MAG TPA: hypothetical protein VMR21_11475 [Vicinamibacteria bacterium]|nr:hypothetical protein [Vicinamibacteria bacterium]